MRNPALMAALLAVFPAIHAAVPSGVDGTWYNPAQAGHGLSIEMAGADRAVVLWYTYDIDGAPLTLYLDGRVEGDAITAVAYAPRGMRFGTFDPLHLQMPTWGSVDIEFADCNTATLHYRSQVPGNGNGSVPLQRLANAAPPTCSLAQPERLPAGDYRSNEPLLEGVVGADGRFFGAWARLSWTHEDASVLIGVPREQRAGHARLQFNALRNDWLAPWLGEAGASSLPPPEPFDVDFTLTPEAAVGTHWSDVPLVISSAGRLWRSADPGRWSARSVFGFHVPGDASQQRRGAIELEAGELCVRIAGSECLYRGEATDYDEDAGSFAFELRRVDVPAAPLVGRGKLRTWNIAHTLHGTLTLYGSDGDSGVAVTGGAANL